MALGWYPVWMPVTVGYHRGLSWDSSCFTSLSMTRRRQQKALLWSLQMSQNWGGGGGDQLIGWRDRPAWMLSVIDGNKAVLPYISRRSDTKCTDLSQPPPVLLFTVQLYLLVVVFCSVSFCKWTTGHWPVPRARIHHSTDLSLFQLSLCYCFPSCPSGPGKSHKILFRLKSYSSQAVTCFTACISL